MTKAIDSIGIRVAIEPGIVKFRWGIRVLKFLQPRTTYKQKVTYMPNVTPSSYRIYTGFTKGTDNDVNNLSLDVIGGLTDNPSFLQPPVDPAALTALQVAFNSAMTDARKGGRDRTRAKNVAKQALIDDLIKDAFYCQGEARYDLDALLSTGFDVVSKNRTAAPLNQPGIITILNDMSGQLTVRGGSVLNGRVYKVQTSKDNGVTWTDAGTFNGARSMVVTPTTPGTLYQVRFCALGGSTGQSPWSNPVACMAT